MATDFATPLVLSFLAGMSTCLGAAVAFCCNQGKGRKPRLNQGHLVFSLSLAASVMVTVSVTSLLPEAFAMSESEFLPPESSEFWERCLAFAFGCALYALLSKCAFPEPEEILGFDEVKSARSAPSPSSSFLSSDTASSTNDQIEDTMKLPLMARRPSTLSLKHLPHDSSGPPSNNSPLLPHKYISKHDKEESLEARRKWRVTMILFVSLVVHNFPEGLAVAASSMHSQHLGWTTTAAIALHNIPEGIAIAVPCIAARPDAPWLAFGLASLSGLAEPLGALVALVVFGQTGTGMWEMENILSFVAAIMMMVSCVELFPEARRNIKGRAHLIHCVTGILTGAIVMLASDAYLDG